MTRRLRKSELAIVSSAASFAASSHSPLQTAVIDSWFHEREWEPFEFQREVWREYLAGRSGLLHATTGTGKTYAAWLGPVIEWLNESGEEKPSKEAPPLTVLWITPLRALAADTAAALKKPLDELGIGWTLETRTGDTSSSVKAKQRKKLPTALVTTPESLTHLLTRVEAREVFANLKCVIVDEWHELLGSKRGVQTELALARLKTFAPKLRVWGLSATLGNLDVAMQTLLGDDHNNGHIVSGDFAKEYRLHSFLPEHMEQLPWAGHIGLKLLPQILAQLDQGGTALVFANTRNQTEIWYQAILHARPEWAGEIAIHHGSLDQSVRGWVEEGLKAGTLRCVVCTSSLDLGVDFSPVDRVFQIGSPKGVARLMQRAGRSGHRPGEVSDVYCVPTHAFELVEVAAAREAIEARAIEPRIPYEKLLDVLAQHAISMALAGGYREQDLFEEIRTTYAYRNLTRDEWEWILDFVTRGGPTLKAYPDYQKVRIDEDGRYVLDDKVKARRHRMTIGTISSDASIVVQYLKGGRLGTVEESFISKINIGDTFSFAGKQLQLVQVRDMKAYVRKATKRPNTLPRWMGGRMPFSTELAHAVRVKLQQAKAGLFEGSEMKAVKEILQLQEAWSVVPAENELLVEQMKSRDGYHLFFYPFGGRLVHEGLSALIAFRISQSIPISFTFSINDYGFELLSRDEIPFERCLERGLFATENLDEDTMSSMNAAEMARRHFRDIARIAGLIFVGFPGQNKTAKQLQASSGLIYDVFQNYDPENLLLKQAQREVLERQLERTRMLATLEKMQSHNLVVTSPPRFTPFAFPLMVDRLRGKLTSEQLSARIEKMQLWTQKDEVPPRRGRKRET